MASRHAHFSIPSILALICALTSFAAGALPALVLASVALIFGFLGVMLSLSPRVRGGLVSALAMMLGLGGIVAAVFRFLQGRWL